MRVDSTWLGTRCVDFVMAVLLVAGIGKAADADLSTQLIAEWGVFESAGLNTALVLAIISSELTISGGWYLGLRRNAAVAACGMFLLAGLVVFFVLSLGGPPPACGCFGLLAQHYDQADTLGSAMIRNALLLGLLGVGAVLRCTPISRSVE